MHVTLRFVTVDFDDGVATMQVGSTTSAREGATNIVRFEGDPAARGTFSLGRLEVPIDRIVVHREEDAARSFIELGIFATAWSCTFDPRAFKVLEDPTCEMLLDGIEPPEHCGYPHLEQRDASTSMGGFDQALRPVHR